MDISTANRLYELRKQHGLSQDELAEKLNVSRQAVSKWERSESSPDTDNLIALAKLYGISLDELLNYTPQKATDDEQDAQSSDAQENENKSQETSGFTYTGDGECVHIDENGIHVHDKDGSNVVIKGGIAKFVNKIVGEIHVDDKNGTSNKQNEDKNGDNGKTDEAKGGFVHVENGHITFTDKRAKNIAIWSSAVNGTAFLLCTIAYLLIGLLCKLWHPGWILFFIPLIVGGIFDCAVKKNPSAFPIVLIVVAVYLFLGCAWGLWHPYWALFLIIPAYYCIVEPIKRTIKKKHIFNININRVNDNNDDNIDDNIDNQR